MKIVFIEDMKVRIYFKNPLAELFSGGNVNYTVAPYVYEGNKIIIKDKLKDTEVLIRDQGNKLVIVSDEANFILEKLY